MEIKLFEPEDMKTGRGGGKGGEKYGKYKAAIAPHLEFIKDGIDGSKDGKIRVKIDDLAKAMGMSGKHNTSLYWGLRFVLFQEDIIVEQGKTKGGDAVLIMREKVEGDVLPESLAKHLAGATTGEAGSGEGEVEAGSGEGEVEAGTEE